MTNKSEYLQIKLGKLWKLYSDEERKSISKKAYEHLKDDKRGYVKTNNRLMVRIYEWVAICDYNGNILAEMKRQKYQLKYT